jgi:hypothetical protein
MADAKETREIKGTPEKARKLVSDKAIELVRARKARKSDNRVFLYVVLVVFVIAMALLLSGAFKKKPAGSLASAVKRETKGAARRVRQGLADRPKKQTAPAAAGNLARKPAPRRQRERGVSRAERRRAPRERIPRQPRSKRSGSRRTAPESSVITVIGEGTALIGNRTVRSGDVIRGRIVRDIGADFIRLEYGGASYTLKVGDELP